MSRAQKPADRKVLRRLHAAAGSRAELNRWIDRALSEGKQRSGPKEYALGLTLDDYERIAAAPKGKRTKLIGQLVRDNPGLLGRTSVQKNTVARINAKLRELDKQMQPFIDAALAVGRQFADLESTINRRLTDLLRDTK
jgi:hypothetical protein